MTNAWDRAAELSEKHSNSGGMFIRLTSHGDKVVGAFCGDPFSREVVWTGEKYETYDPEVHTDKRPSLRVMLNFYVPAEHDMKIIEGGTVWFKDVLKVRDKYGLEKWLFEIERHGESGDPKTKYTILPEEPITDAERAGITEAGQHDLGALSGDSAEDEAVVDRTAPIKIEVAQALVTRLKTLPRAMVGDFLEALNAKRVRDILAIDAEEAERMLARMESEAQAAQNAIDPFA